MSERDWINRYFFIYNRFYPFIDCLNCLFAVGEKINTNKRANRTTSHS